MKIKKKNLCQNHGVEELVRDICPFGPLLKLLMLCNFNF